MTDERLVSSHPDPDNPGWLIWEVADPTRFNRAVLGKLLARREGERSARLRMFPERHHSNLLDNVHGGITMSLADICLFATTQLVTGADTIGAVTIEMSTHFLGAGRVGVPLDAVGEVLRETRRLVFLRGVVEQEGELTASFSATIRKMSAPK